ncbi:Protocadherin Fat 4 [Penaeus vannamei]|uniref:Protocadherin Fat 4 n=1 Tax=Penaeus vannamei TaxID=6689 RepID=A0A3R7PEV9_PENVA|nr:Protocadherin Fat 4 [Penaeus vannamei]
MGSEQRTTRLLSGSGVAALGFTEPRYCAVLSEDAPLAAVVTTVTAIHKQDEVVRYSITGGNRDGLFTIDQNTGVITLAAALDYEMHDKHELVVAGEAGGLVVHTIVQVRVVDVNDNAPSFVTPDPEVTLVEEDDRDLPQTLIKSSHHYVVEKFPPHKQHHSFQRPISKGFRNDIMFKGSEKERLATVYCYWHRVVLCKKSGNLSSEVCGIEVSPL